MGIKYNGSGVQAIYYNGFTIAKMMNNGNGVWTKPLGSIIIQSRWAECKTTINNAPTAFTQFTHPTGYKAYSYGGRLYLEDSELRLGHGEQGTANFFAMNIPDLAGKDYNFEVSLNNNFYDGSENARIILQGTDNDNLTSPNNGVNGIGTGLLNITRNVTYRYYFGKFGNTSLGDLSLNIPTVFQPYQLVELGLPGEYIYTQQRRGTQLYVKGVSRANGTVYFERTFENVVFNDTGTIMAIQYDATAYGKYIRNFTLEILP